jgi:hypothetical protein
MVFLETLYIPLLLVHLFLTFLLVGGLTHNLLCVKDYVRGKFGRERLELRYLKVSFWAYLAVYLLGALIYPAYRIYVRRDYFDPHVPWATGLFEVKEHWAAVGLALFFGYYLLRRSFRPSEEQEKLWLYVPLTVLLNVIVWYVVVVGCWLTSLKGSW